MILINDLHTNVVVLITPKYNYKMCYSGFGCGLNLLVLEKVYIAFVFELFIGHYAV